MVAPPWYELPPQGYGGLEVIAAALVDALVDRGHEVTLFGAGTRCGTRARFVSTHPDLRYPRLGELMPAVLHTAQVNRMLRDGDFDIVHDHTTDGAMTVPTRRAPTVTTVHGTVDGELGDYLAALGDTVRLVAISQAQRQQRPDLAWTATVHNALPPHAVDGGGLPNPDGPVLWLARFSPDKGPDLAIEACRAAGLPLVLAGKANEMAEERYLDGVIRPMVGDGVRLVVNGDRASIGRLLREARCLIMPIRWSEPFGMVMIEAMAAGTPVVALRRGAVPELVRHGLTGWLCDSAQELPDALHRVGDLDPDACVAHVREKYTAALMARRYERIYLDTIGRPEVLGSRRRRRVDVRPSPAPVLRRPERRLRHMR
jgi:glycosyltransferase involved in cell wall biosynthesis